MNKYELTVILEGKATAAKKKSVLETLEKSIKLLEGKIEKTEDWGVKELFHEIRKVKEGLYLHMPFELLAKSIKPLEIKLKAEENILRYLIVRTEAQK
ncbi:MAG: ribosomal protein S6 RpsF [uncultured bacterium]|nr:MAG: ribosomal protein S6 RpsF [uncultured bacterium]